jgi:predicted dehydrogenase
MRFALLGNHPDGVAFAHALVASGRHELVAFTAPVPFDVSRPEPSASPVGAFAVAGALTDRPAASPAPIATDAVRRPGDLEEILADPAIEAVIVAGRLSDRPALLRRALQSERHVLCVHPADERPETAYEANMIRQDVRRVLLPLLPEALHPAVGRLAEFVEQSAVRNPHSGIGKLRLLEVERAATGEVLLSVGDAGEKPCFPGWDVLRRLGGEVAEVSAFTAEEEPEAGAPVLVSGRFERGGLFQVALLPNRPDESMRLRVVGDRGAAELRFPQGWDGPALLGWRDTAGEYREEYWDRWDPWPTLVEDFERRLEKESADGADWQNEVRALELDDSTRRSMRLRRTSLLAYPDASEEVGFKGTMTLVGCGVLWLVLGLLIASRWWPVVGWLILPLLAVFLGLQFLRYAVPPKEQKEQGGEKK